AADSTTPDTVAPRSNNSTTLQLSTDAPRTADSTTPSTAPTCANDNNLPSFLPQNILCYLQGVSTTATWQNLITELFEFEKTGPITGKLPATNRPVEVASWIKWHMYKKHEPVPVDPSEYGPHFSAWWKAIQPTWRLQEDDGCRLNRSVPDGEVWAVVGKGGLAGFYLVAFALSWWIAALGSAPNEEAWASVDDVSWVLRQVRTLAHVSSTKKRRQGDVEDIEEALPNRHK
ncbi:hypothetical protein JOM56_003782, partial [Amanita muscaria]